MRTCAIIGCENNDRDNPEKYFFTSSTVENIKQLWISATGRNYNVTSRFLVCHDHFEVCIEVFFFSEN